MTISNLKSMVESILKEFEESRNDDKLLVWKFWNRFYYIQDSINYEKFCDLPAVYEIVRLRQVIQNEEKKYIPTSEEVAKKRGWREDEWRYELGYKLLPPTEVKC